VPRKFLLLIFGSLSTKGLPDVKFWKEYPPPGPVSVALVLPSGRFRLTVTPSGPAPSDWGHDLPPAALFTIPVKENLETRGVDKTRGRVYLPNGGFVSWAGGRPLQSSSVRLNLHALLPAALFTAANLKRFYCSLYC
jgi:hypothetical protein